MINCRFIKCTSAYPSKPEDANLLTIKNLSETFGVIAGLSDHTLGITVPITA
jgi:pseudaminic acid synthase